MYGTIVLRLSKASPPALMDTCKFKSISINETESSNGASFQEGELEYTFSLQGPDWEVHSAHSALYWNERCAAWLPERVKSFWEIKDSEDGYMAVFSPLHHPFFDSPFNSEGKKVIEEADDADAFHTWLCADECQSTMMIRLN